MLDTGPNTTAGWQIPHIQHRLPRLIFSLSSPVRNLRCHSHNHRRNHPHHHSLLHSTPRSGGPRQAPLEADQAESDDVIDVWTGDDGEFGCEADFEYGGVYAGARLA